MADDGRARDATSGWDWCPARRIFEKGRDVWPELALPFELFDAYFARHAMPDAVAQEGNAADMYLACASAHGIDGAFARLEPTMIGDVARAVATVDSSPAFVEEVLQALRERLLVRRGPEPSKISDYAGLASLRSWLCAVAVRWAISQRRRKSAQRHTSFRPDQDKRLANTGPEYEYLRQRYKGVFEEAVRDAIRRMPAEQRLLLRLNLVDGMSVDKLGALYKVGRSTAARWLASARRALFEAVRGDLRDKLRLTSTELDSLGGDLRSLLDVSVFEVLASADHGTYVA